MDRVIVGVDGSDTAAKAAHRAAELASSLDADLVVVSAFQTTETVTIGTGSDSISLPAADLAEKIAAQAIASFADRLPELHATPRGVYGRPSKALVVVAEELEATLIVIGNKRVQGPSRVLGSIAADVARHAPCDVYIVNTI